MLTPIPELVQFIGKETPLLNHLKEVVAWIASMPEGMKILQQARAMHGKPVTIFVDEKSVESCYGHFTLIDRDGKQTEIDHAICITPASFKMPLNGSNGEKFLMTPARLLAHEFKHAAQEFALEETAAYNQRYYEINRETSEKLGFLDPNTALNEMIQPYIHRFKAARSDEERLKIFSDMYDERIAPIAAKIKDSEADFQKKMSADPIVRRFVENFEIPAIEFENTMMRHKGEPERTTDYIGSFAYSQWLENVGDKDKWVNLQMDSFAVANSRNAGRAAG